MYKYRLGVCLTVVSLFASGVVSADDCPFPTLSQCLSDDYLGSSCGAVHFDDCRVLVGDDFRNRLGGEGLDPQRFFRLDGSPERLRSVVADRFAPLTLPDHGSAVYNQLVGNGELNPTASRHPEWETNGTTVNSCKEYVYKKYYDYNRLEDAIKAYGDNYEGVYRMMILGEGDIAPLPGRLLRNRDSAPMATQPAVPAPSSVKNPFFTSWSIVLQDLQSLPEYSFDPEFHFFVDDLGVQFRNSHGHDNWGNDWAYHVAGHSELWTYEFSSQAVAHIDNNSDRYKALVDDFVSQKLFGHGAGAGSGFCNPPEGPCDLNGLRQAIVDMLTDELNREWLFSCLNLAEDSCDWSPRILSKAYVNLYPERERDLTRCVDITAAPGGFGGLVPPVRRANLATFENFLTESAAAQEQLRRNAPWMPNAPHRNTIGRTSGDHHSWSWDAMNVSAGYDYDYGWSAWVPTSRGIPICQLGTEAHGNGDFWAQTPLGRVQVLETHNNMQINPGGDGHIHSDTVLFGGVQLYNPIDRDFLNGVNTDHQRNFQLIIWDRYYPILSLNLHVNFTASATTGLQLGASFTPGLFSCDPQTNNMYFAAHAKPYASIDVSSAVGVGIVVAEVGVEGNVNLFNIALPFDASAQLANNTLSLLENGTLKYGSGGGRVDIYAKVGICPICEKARKKIGSWEGARWEASLTSANYQFDLSPLQAILQ